ncbi:MAG TPA: hypothetical protein VID69_00665, partial [Actinomycetota bacterium]
MPSASTNHTATAIAIAWVRPAETDEIPIPTPTPAVPTASVAATSAPNGARSVTFATPARTSAASPNPAATVSQSAALSPRKSPATRLVRDTGWTIIIARSPRSRAPAMLPAPSSNPSRGGRSTPRFTSPAEAGPTPDRPSPR